MKPLLLDTFCGAGGCTKGYQRAGFFVVGVDIEPQKRYVGDEFYQGDALEFIREFGHEFDVIHASPVCKGYSNITPKATKGDHPLQIPDVRAALKETGKLYVIENVAGAKRELVAPVMVCGAMLGLKVYRHRWFESNVMLFGTPHYPHRDNTPPAGHAMSRKGFVSVTSGGLGITEEQLQDFQQYEAHPNAKRRSGVYGISDKGFVSVTGHFSGIQYCREAMGINWMVGDELAQAIPPAYTEYLGKQLMSIIENKHSYR